MLDRLSDILTEVGATLLDLRERGPIAGSWADASQFKAKADMIVHEKLIRDLGALTPGIPVISEEDARHERSRPARYWLIDPIDGTASYAGGFDGFVTQSALMRDGAPVLAVVHGPALGLTYRAERGEGATLNGMPLDVRSGDPDRAVLIDNYPEPRGTALAAFEELSMTGYMESGSIALKICRVADGMADLFFKDVILRDWDVAPGELILSEAGGVLTGIQGAAFPYAGDWVKPGVIAARSRALLERFVDWRAARETSE
jgi:3'(2'), 5'-bisphosphate nucleotidase